eukprot:TRINITY_DN6062_c0_g1_i1.p1 TRINITY_DN6062_c0_g1~~TRINITY_DN6062_c0_g1_i1.p1  ORF type:complete len:184 (+),score=45.47 TRINITY_DN6062_c0_g1_i1:726-1277(+)
MSLEDVFQNLNSDEETSTRNRIYLRAPFYDSLLPDVVLPQFFLNLEEGENFRTDISGLWIGTKGNVTPLHYDLWHGLLVQISGRKSVVLFSPDDSSMMYQNSGLSGNSHVSKLDLCTLHQQESRKRFGKIFEATAYYAVLEPGEVLYIPPCWWHDVVSLDNSLSLTLRWSLGKLEKVHPCAIK